MPIIENQYNVKCFPNQKTYWHYDDKIREYFLFNAKGYPFLKSWVFWDKESAYEFVDKTDFPIVFKLKNGAGSSNVILIKSKREAKRIIKKMFGKGIAAGEIPSKSNVKYNDLKKHFKRKINKLYYDRKMNIEAQHWQY